MEQGGRFFICNKSLTFCNKNTNYSTRSYRIFAEQFITNKK